MKIGTKFNSLTHSEYVYIIEHRHRYTDFNSLGLYRSLLENDKLDLNEKIAIRELAHQHFGKTFEFLQLKDPFTYIGVSTLGQELTIADERQWWQNVRTNQQKILTEKRIKHRNFGIYAKHECGYEDCPLNGVMARQGSRLSDGCMRFESDKRSYNKTLKAYRAAAERRSIRDDRHILDDL